MDIATRRRRISELEKRIIALNCQFVNLGSFQGRAGMHASRRVATQAADLDREYGEHVKILKAAVSNA